MKRALLIVLAICTVLVAGTIIALPHLPALLREGFPPQVLPDDGPLREVTGAARAQVPLSPDVTMPADALELFDGSGGAAMLLDSGGALTGEHYGEGFDRDTRFNSYSMVKSLVGLLVLRAFADGVLTREQSVRDVLGPEAPNITIGAVLEMSGGLAATAATQKVDRDEGYSPFSTLGRLHVMGPDAVLADLGIRTDWQGSFHYQSANTALLGRALEVAYDKPLNALLSDTIWQPAGADTAYWRHYPQGDGVAAYCCLYARALDWLLVGRYILDNGTPEAPLLPDDMWQAWVQPDLPAEVRRAGAYGDHLRHDVLDRDGADVSGPFAYAMGHNGQVLYLFAQEDVVVVRFGDGPQLLHSTLYTLLVAE